jgi:hypothetical protein
MGKTIDLKAADGHAFKAYLAEPASQPRGAVGPNSAGAGAGPASLARLQVEEGSVNRPPGLTGWAVFIWGDVPCRQSRASRCRAGRFSVML